MTDPGNDGTSPDDAGPGALRPEVVGVDTGPGTGTGTGTGGATPGDADAESPAESIERPGKVLRIGSMVKQLLEEVRQAPLDEAGRKRLREIYEQSVSELSDGLSPELMAELERVTIPFGDDVPTEAELRVAQAQLVGWLEGLFHGIQAALVAQQMAARAQLDEMRQRSLPPGGEAGIGRPGTYL